MDKRHTPNEAAKATQFKKGHGSLGGGGRPKGPSFGSTIRDILTKNKRFRRSDGKLFESTELVLIVRRAIKTLRTSPEFDVKLFTALMDRMDGKPKDNIDVEGIKEIANDIDAREVILSRLAGIALARGHNQGDRRDDSGRTIDLPVSVESLGKN